ncbi:MAG: type II toxin-antitoxin system RelE/ParE family toxin [Anaerolineales bacterium]|nr:type II toxin-antitoxin system RelE/ParE family toxin [Anaerolineales bacterium]
MPTDLLRLRVPPSNRLHALSGNPKGLSSMSINRQWLICFRFEDGVTYDVETVDYH